MFQQKLLVMTFKGGVFNGNHWGSVHVLQERSDFSTEVGLSPIEMDINANALEQLKPYEKVLPIVVTASCELISMKNANNARKGGAKIISVEPCSGTLGMFDTLLKELFAAADKPKQTQVSGFTPPASSPAAPSAGMVIKS